MSAVIPCLAILLYSGLERRQHLIEMAKSDVLLLTRTMAEAQKKITQSTIQTLSILSRLPSIQNMDPVESTTLLKSVLEHNLNYSNIALVDLNGEVFASGKTFTKTNLADRKHFKEAMSRKNFAVGEYILTRVGTTNPAFPFAFPVLDREGRLKAILTAVVKLDVFSRFYDVSTLPEKSFVAVTDYKGTRMFYYPAQKNTNPIGKPIKTKSWNIAANGEENGLFIGIGSDGLRRIFAYEKIHLEHDDTPYLYLWAGIPEGYLLKPANAALIRNLLLMLLTTAMSLFISWMIGKNTLIFPIQNLVTLTQKFTRGDFDARSEVTSFSGEVGILTKAFHDMAKTLTMNKKNLEESELKFRLLADYTLDWEYWVDPDGKFIYLSPSCQQITGYSPEEIISDPQLIFKMVKPDYMEKVHHHYFDEGIEDASVFSMEFPIITKDGEEVWLEHNCSPVYNDHGKYAGRRGNNRDITDRKRAEKEKIQLEEQYRQAQKMESVGRLAGGVAHDYDNALSVIMGYTELAMADINPSDPLHADLNQVLMAAKRATDITRQLLAFARKQNIAPEVLDLNRNVETMLKMLRRLIGEDIDLAWLPGTNLWNVKVDPSQTDQILANLCVNARDAIEGVGKITIETDTITFDKAYCADHTGFVPGEFVLLTVSDNGCGMSKEILGKIFEPFFTTKDVDKGTGLGLATVYGIVKQNKGFINVYSEPGKGTAVKIYLPREKGKSADIRKESMPEIPQGSGETILLVEDDLPILELAKKILESLDYKLLTADTPQKAMGLAQNYEEKIHLLVTDVIMPEMNGLELANRLQSLYPGLKRMFMSGYTANAIAHHGVLDKGVYFIQKPFSRSELSQIVRKVLDE